MEYENTVSAAPVNDPWGAIADVPPPKPLEAGEYCFRVVKMTKGIWAQTTKLAGSARADLELRLWNADGTTGECRATLTLHPSFAWKVRSFWKCVGENVVDGQPFLPDWDSIVGRVGRCKVSLREYTSTRDNQKHQAPDVEAWLAPDPDKPLAPEPGGEFDQAVANGDVPF